MSTMPADASAKDIELVLIGLAELQQIAAGERVELGKAAFEGALPPGHVATLALAEIDAGTPHRWCMPFLIVSGSRNAILGSCRFKTVPVEGEVEISYGIAREVRGQGFGTVAIARLLQLATADRSVRRVIAHILPGNLPSSNLVRRLGFVQDRLFTDMHGDEVARWVWTVPMEA
ncbi:MAG: GNAT family N-acetyltransferase [Steroidobacteraceae bacterium]